MTVAALVNAATGLVENMIEADAGYTAPDGFVAVLSPANFVQIGTTWDGNAFIDPNPHHVAPAVAGLRTV